MPNPLPNITPPILIGTTPIKVCVIKTIPLTTKLNPIINKAFFISVLRVTTPHIVHCLVSVFLLFVFTIQSLLFNN
jgi:hypothetical protein